jgi:hypothetical protein
MGGVPCTARNLLAEARATASPGTCSLSGEGAPLLLRDIGLSRSRNQKVTCASESIPRVDLGAWAEERAP